MAAGEYALIGTTLNMYEGKNFYFIAMEARDAPELKNVDCKIIYDKPNGITSYSHGTVALAWFRANKKILLVQHPTHGSGAAAAATPVKKKKLIPSVLELGDDF